MLTNTNLKLELNIDSELSFGEWESKISPLKTPSDDTNSYGSFADTNEYLNFPVCIISPRKELIDVLTYLPIMFNDKLIIDNNYFIRECEKQLMNTNHHYCNDNEDLSFVDFKLQSDEIEINDFMEIFKSYTIHASMGISALKELLSKENYNFWMKLLEDLGLTIYQIYNSKNVVDISIAWITFLKLRNNGPLIDNKHIEYLQQMLNDMFNEMTPQSMEEELHKARNFMNKYEELKHAPIFKKMYKIMMYVLSFSLFDKMGINFDLLRYSKLEQEALKKQYYSRLDFSMVLFDTILFICERGCQCMQTGSLDPIYHTGSKYEDWYRLVSRLKREAQFLSNPEPHGINKFKFLAELDDAIDKGNAIYKHASRIGELEKSTVRYMLQDLELIRSSELSKKAACKERKAPFSVLLYGGSSVAKSTLTRMLFYHYGKLFDLPIGSEYKYTRIFNDEYWSGFRTNMWCGQVDDIAPLNPNAAQGVDETLLEVIRIQNSVPYVPPQAELCDKGRTPVNFRFFIATTNTEHLNAHAYFACPLAVQRRFPFVIEIRPKNEFLKDGCMLDGAKVPPIEEGEYPDYWIFKVKRVVPANGNIQSQRGSLELIDEYDNVYDFMRWFSKEAIKYEELQNKTLDCDINMSKVELCKLCYLPKSKCICEIQSVEILSSNSTEFENNFYITLYGSILAMFWWCIFNIPLLSLFIHYTIGYRKMFVMFGRYIFDDRVMYFFYRRLGNRIQNKIGKYKPIINLVCLGTFGILLYKFCASVLNFKKKEPKQKLCKEVSCDTSDIYVMESDERVSQNIGISPKTCGEERENVWYKNDFQITNFDVSPMNTSYMGFSLDHVMNILLKNCVFFKFRYTRQVDGIVKNFSRPNKAICIAGHVYMCNNHAVPDIDTFDLEIINDVSKEGINSNITILVDQREVIRYPALDIAFIVIRSMPPRKNIVNLFCKETLRGQFKGMYLGRNYDGTSFKKIVHNITFRPQFENVHLNSKIDSWNGFVESPTLVGDCGSVLLCESGFGPILLGLHYLGSPNCQVISMMVTQEFLKGVLDGMKVVIVQSNNPELSSGKCVRKIGALNKKSTVRYLEEGSANVYGSFEGFRQKPKSCVGSTLIRESMINRGYQVKCGKPVMNGWEPWHLAIKDMVKPSTTFNNYILKECTESFIHDIMSSISKEEIDQVCVYDNVTALNGAAGVSYVDKINRNTSAGNPWKKSKKFFIKSVPPINGLMDPIEADAEIMDRVDDCINKYMKGYRYMPNFCAHLKDEPTAFKKIESKKTRVFTGAPFDWTIVVRKYLLSLIRLIQNNKYVFECAPGTIAQSIEWEDIRTYLTQFGDHRIIAGDHGKFDKKMASSFILAAFDILIYICRAAGYTEEEILVVQGIAEDTAFPLVDFDGDLIEFFGSNPSGHPLTVIINSLVNSLYMRYCFHVLSPWGHCRNFTQYVNLMTYGDDLVEGVSEEIEWFTHTNIQRVLADIGLEFTMADKEAKSVPFIHIDETSFLKRMWRYDNDVGAYLCPLEHSSIEKMVTTCVVSKTISPEAQAIAVISTAIREYFFYGKQTFEKRRNMFKEVVRENNLDLYVQESTFPTWEELNDLFWEASKRIKRYSGKKLSK